LFLEAEEFRFWRGRFCLETSRNVCYRRRTNKPVKNQNKLKINVIALGMEIQVR